MLKTKLQSSPTIFCQSFQQINHKYLIVQSNRAKNGQNCAFEVKSMKLCTVVICTK